MTGEQPVHCEVCGRKLLTPQSRRRGRGQVCDEKVNPIRGRDHSPTRLRTGRRPPGRPRGAPAGAGGADPSLLDELEEQP